MFDKIKLLFVVLQKGQELANADAWKNTQAAMSALGAIIAAVVAFAPFPMPPEITMAIAGGVVAVVQLVQLYLTYATSKRVGVPAGSSPADPATITG
jgi:hypothetical protein